MNSEFEKRLQRQPLRPIPGEWRTEILHATRNAAAPGRKSSAAPQSLFAILNEKISALLWPHPKAWAGLAAVWLVILAMNIYTSDHTPKMVKNEARPSPELILALREQRRELARLIEPTASSDTDQPKSFHPSPRSERRDEMLAA